MDLRKRIIKAAIEIFGEYGYEKATIAQIVERAGSSKGGFYHHFEGKKEILDEINNTYFKEVSDGIEKILADADDDTVYCLNNVFTAVNDFKKSKLDSARELNNMYAHADSESIRLNNYIQFIELISGIYEKLIKKGMKEGLFNPISPKGLAGMWSYEVTQLYGQINIIILNKGNKDMYNEFLAQAKFVEDSINHGLGWDKRLIKIKEPMVKYLDLALEKIYKTKNS